MDQRPIGVFDSGLGGLTAVHSLWKILPEEDLIYFPPVQLHQLAHLMMQAVGEDQALHLVVFLDAVVFPGGVDDPVSYVHQVQQIPELLFRQFDLHGADTSQMDDRVG